VSVAEIPTGAEDDGCCAQRIHSEQPSGRQVIALDASAETAPDPPVVVEANRRRRVTPRSWLAAVVLVAVLAGAGYGGWLLVQHWEVHTASEEALKAAENYVLKLTNIDADTVDKNFADISDGATGEFHRMQTKSGAKLRQLFIDNKVTARGHVIESAVKSAAKNNVVVVLVVNQSVINKDTRAPVIDRSRIRMTMQKVDGRWLASKVELL
jgi:Mce-associated membrane protein